MITQDHNVTMTRDDLASLGIDGLAYIKAISSDNGKSSYAVHAADGTRLQLYADRNTAVAVVRQNGLTAMSLH